MPPVPVMLMLPVAPLPTTAVILVSVNTVKEVAGILPKLSAVAPVKFAPIMVTVVPAKAESGVTALIKGGGKKVKPGKEALPVSVVILTLPDAPLATLAEMLVSVLAKKNCAGTPPKLTAVAPDKPVPFICTVTPCLAAVGVKELITGAGPNV